MFVALRSDIDEKKCQRFNLTQGSSSIPYDIEDLLVMSSRRGVLVPTAKLLTLPVFPKKAYQCSFA